MTLSEIDERTDPDCLSEAAAGAMLEEAPWRSFVTIGDSIAAGVREPLEGYVDSSMSQRLEAALRQVNPETSCVNIAERDLRLPAILDSQLPSALELRPDLVLISAGGNDAMRSSFRPDTIRADLIRLAEPLAKSGALIVTSGLFDIWRSGLIQNHVTGEMAERFDVLDALTSEVAAGLGGVHVDLHHHSYATDPGIFSSDLMHANARGHAIAASATVEALGTYLNTTSARSE